MKSSVKSRERGRSLEEWIIDNMKTLITEIIKINNEPAVLIPESILECVDMRVGDEVNVFLNKLKKAVVIEKVKKNHSLI